MSNPIARNTDQNKKCELGSLTQLRRHARLGRHVRLMRHARLGNFAQIALLAATLGGGTLSCSEAPLSSLRTGDFGFGIFSTQPSAGESTLVMVRLSRPPALATSSAQANGSGRKIDSDLVSAIDKEQADFELNLKSLTSEYTVLYRYRLLVNALAIVVPTRIADRVRALSGVASVESSFEFDRPRAEQIPLSQRDPASIQKANSVEFIGATRLHQAGIRGKGIRVGVIDTGIDYTHSMLGGSGDPKDYESIDPSQPSPQFPNSKVVGGLDFVGSDYSAGADRAEFRIPKPDSNPIDEDDHGTHVAGSIAGLGDGVNAHDGVAPDAILYALKVFGKSGSTSDSVVIAALEWAADPNRDGDLSDALDVVNLSLGGNFGVGGVLYSQAVSNLSRAGTVVVASAGNSGDTPYVVGSPSTSEDAISVAATVDHAEHNWKFRAVQISSGSASGFATELAEAIEGPVTEPIASLQPTRGALVPIGLAAGPLPDDVKSKLAGQVALIDRGQIPFVEKIKNAVDAGAIGVLMVNNVDSTPIEMGGGEPGFKPFPIPAIMITRSLGAKIKEAIDGGQTLFADFHTNERIERPELIDTIADFSSRGPRSLDAAFKPEIGAPGMRIISASASEGSKVKSMNGTSMAGPHIAGASALLKQARPGLSAREYKSLMMATAVPQNDETGERYSLSRQGAGRVQLESAVAQLTATEPAALSLGETPLEKAKAIDRHIGIKNLSAQKQTYTIEFEALTPGLSMSVNTPRFEIQANETLNLPLRFVIRPPASDSGEREYEGAILIAASDTKQVTRVPVLGVVNLITDLRVNDLTVLSSSSRDSVGAAVDISFENKSTRPALAIPMNWLMSEDRRRASPLDPFQNRICDLQSAGYRIVERDGERRLQLGLKLFEPVTTWDLCEVSALFDIDGDRDPDQELVGTKAENLPGLSGEELVSLLIDFKAARAIRLAYEKAITEYDPQNPGDTDRPSLDYTDALDDFEAATGFSSSTIKIIETRLTQLKRKSDGSVQVFIATSPQASWTTSEINRSIARPEVWRTINLNPNGESFVGLPEQVEVPAETTQTVSVQKGGAVGQMIVFFPSGAPLLSGLGQDDQAQIPRIRYRSPVEPTQ